MLPSRVTYSGLLDAGRQKANSRVHDLERILLAQPQVDLGTEDMTHGGMHIRWIFLPAGTILTGATTKKDNVCVVFGEIEVTTENGPLRLAGFNVLPAEAGSKRAGHAITDTWWATAWRTDLKELHAIEDEMTDESASLQTRRTEIEWAKRPELES